MNTEADKEAVVLVGYAATMEAIQEFEQTLRQLAVLRADLPDGIGFDTAWKRTEKLLRLPMGKLEYVLPDGLREHFSELRKTRNWAAHEALVLWRFERSVGIRGDDEFVELLTEIEQTFRQLDQQLSTVADQHLERLGITPEDYNFSRDEIRRMALGEGND